MEVRSGRRRARRSITLTALLLISATVSPTFAGAAFPGPNGRIAFVNRVKDGGRQIFSMAPDGSDVRQLTATKTGEALHPAWSPDGSSILFFKGEHGLESIWVMDADGSNKTKLFGDTSFQYLQPSYSPDGSAIVFTRCKPNFHACDLETADADGGNVQRLTAFGPGVYDLWSNLSPDGTQIAFTSFNRDGVNAAAYVVASDGTQIERVTPIPLQATNPDWAPDGSKLLVDSAHGSIYQVNPDGTGLLRLVNPPSPLIDFDPAFSPAGDLIAFSQGYRSAGRHLPGIWVMAADGSGATRIARRGYQAAWGSAP